MSKLEKFLKESTLSEDAKKLIQEAWDEEKRFVAAEMRQEMKARYEADKIAIVEGLNELSTSVITEELTKFAIERKKLAEDRAVVRSNLAKFANFASHQLVQEVKAHRAERKAIVESLGKFAEFSNKIIAEELSEFQQDKKSLIEAKVKLIADGKRSLNETKSQWVKAASSEAAKFIQEQTEAEFKQLKTELKEAKENMFGRKLFEAFSSEFKNTLFDTNKEFKSVLESLNKEKREKMALAEQLKSTKNKLVESSTRLQVTEDIYKREATLQSLMKPLTAQQRVVMEGLLENTSTAKLNEDFRKYLKPVLNETPVRPQQKKSVIKESTGNRSEPLKNTALNESANDVDDDFNKTLRDLAKNAGI